MSDEAPKHIEASEELKCMYERLCRKPPGSCIGVYELVPIFEVMEISSENHDGKAR